MTDIRRIQRLLSEGEGNSVTCKEKDDRTILSCMGRCLKIYHMCLIWDMEVDCSLVINMRCVKDTAMLYKWMQTVSMTCRMDYPLYTAVIGSWCIKFNNLFYPLKKISF